MQATWQTMIQVSRWSLRWPWASWVRWIPRERNVLADWLANQCLDMRRSFAVYGTLPTESSYNVATVSDGASRASTCISSASWA
eukprot:7403200-Karenia_brevis.AAC.1